MYIEIEKLNYTIFFQLKIIFDEQNDIGNCNVKNIVSKGF